MLLMLINKACKIVQSELLFDQNRTISLEYALEEVRLTSAIEFDYLLDILGSTV
jgi:hypothetical protein